MLSGWMKRGLAGLGLALAMGLAAAASAPTPASAPADDPLAAAGMAKFHVTPVDDAWRAALPRDPDAATQKYMDRLPQDVVARSDAYFEGNYWLQLWNFLLGLVVAGVLLGRRRSARVRDWAQRTGRRPFLRDALYAAVYTLASWVLTLPLTIYQVYYREHEYSMATQTFGPWFAELLTGLAVTTVVSMGVVPALYAVIRRTGERWWLWGTGFAVAFMVVAMMVVPVWIEPLFNTYQPVQDPAIRNAVLAMAHANGTPADSVMEFDASRQTTRVSANVTGVFGSAAVRLNDNLLRRTSLPEIRAVMGHELGHYVMNHLWKGISEFALVLLVVFACTKWGMDRTLARWGRAWGLQGVGDVASLPLLAAVSSVAIFLATPVTNTLTRTQEIEADRFGLNLSREPYGEAEVDLKLTEYRKPDPGPIEEFVFFDHPSTRFRIHDAMVWREAMKM